MKSSRYFGNEDDQFLTYDFKRENVRGNFLKVPGLSRQDFVKTLLGQEAPKTTLSELSQIITTDSLVPDPNDVLWLNEFDTRIANGETEEEILLTPPLGRPQKKIKKKTDIREIYTQLKNAISIAGQDIAQQGTLIANIGNAILQVGYDNNANSRNMLTAINKLTNDFEFGPYSTINLTSAPENFGKRFIPSKLVVENKAVIATYLMHYGPLEQRPISNSIKVYQKDTDSYSLQPIAIIADMLTLQEEYGEQLYLDLRTHSIETQSTIDSLNVLVTSTAEKKKKSLTIL